ncbi:MAG TPA: glycoside hydrolase family 18 protein [Burkholderiaceae bacterium]
MSSISRRFLLALASLALSFSAQAAPAAVAKVVGVYVPGWESEALLDKLQPGSVTHLLYAFLRICGPAELAADKAVCAGKPEFEFNDGEREQRFDKAFAKLKKRLPEAKVVASVGGWGGSDPLFILAAEPAKRAKFAASVTRYLREHPAFDGIDIDWEHPGNNGNVNGIKLGGPEDARNYALLMQGLRIALDALGRETGRSYLLTTAVNVGRGVIANIDFRAAAPALDLVFMMSYDYYGPWSPQAGHHTQLYPSGPEADDSLASSIVNLDAAGVPRSKMVAGVAMYARGFAGVADPKTGAAKTGNWPAESNGELLYRDIAKRYLDAQGRGREGFELIHDKLTGADALYNKALQAYIAFDTPASARAKAVYARAQGLAGVFAWEFSQDNGDILKAMKQGVDQPAEAGKKSPR